MASVEGGQTVEVDLGVHEECMVRRGYRGPRLSVPHSIIKVCHRRQPQVV